MAIKKKKIVLQKNTIFLGLIKKYRVSDTVARHAPTAKYKNSFPFLLFKTYFILLMNTFYVFDLLKSWLYFKNKDYRFSYNLLHYYAAINLYTSATPGPIYKNIINYPQKNMIVFSRPAKQLFLLIFKAKPIFIFTGGLMRIVMREKRKSSKKLYKVATSLIKLFTILLSKKDFFPQGYLKLINVGQLRFKILKNLVKLKTAPKILYIFLKFRVDFTSQKFETRRSIKKYVKKRFKIR